MCVCMDADHNKGRDAVAVLGLSWAGLTSPERHLRLGLTKRGGIGSTHVHGSWSMEQHHIAANFASSFSFSLARLADAYDDIEAPQDPGEARILGRRINSDSLAFRQGSAAYSTTFKSGSCHLARCGSHSSPPSY